MTISWRAPIWQLLYFFTISTLWYLLWHEDPTTPATMAAFLCVASLGGSFLRSTPRHRVAMAVGVVAAFVLPDLAMTLLPAARRQEWYAARPAGFLAAAAAVYLYVAVTRIHGFAPPARKTEEEEEEEAGRTPPQPLWHSHERRALLAEPGQVVIRRPYPIIVNGLLFGFLTFVSFGIAVGELTDGSRTAGVVAALVCVFFGRTAVRSVSVAVIADDDGILVRNLQRTQRVAWAEVRSVVLPSADEFGYLRIDRLHRGPVRCTALARGAFQRRFAVDGPAAALVALVGPSPQPADATG